MKYSVRYSKNFVKSLNKVQQLKAFKPERLRLIIKLLSSGEKLDARFRDHKLSGDLASYRECHVSPDILLIYEIDNEVLILTLVNIGSYSNLFK